MGSCGARPARARRRRPPARRRIVVAPGGAVATVDRRRSALARAGDTVVVTAGVYREPRLDVTVAASPSSARARRSWTAAARTRC